MGEVEIDVGLDLESGKLNVTSFKMVKRQQMLKKKPNP
jgi:hypothetical protein